MLSQKLKISIFFLIAFLLFTGAKPQKSPKKIKKVKKVALTPFQKLRKEYLVYKNSTETKKDLEMFNTFILKFDKFTNSQKNDEAIQSNYYIADINEKIYDLTNNQDYLDRAYNIYKKLSNYNDSYGLASQKKIMLLKNKVNSNENADKKEKVTAAKDRIKLLGIKHTKYDGYSRVVLELNDKCDFEHRYLKGDIENVKPERIVVDIKNTSYSDKNQLEPITLNDEILEKIRIGQFSDDILRVVLDLKKYVKYKTTFLTEPYRIIVDVYSKEVNIDLTDRENKQQDLKLSDKNVVTQLDNLPLKLIVIDMGHGAHDPGAIGYKGLKEKDVTLDIGLKLGEIIKKHFPQIEIVFTRKDDVYLKLDERTAMANAKKADLFVSIHANASKNKEAHGVETYFLNFTKEERAKEVVARENASSIEGVDEVQEILKDLIVSSKYNESSMLAAMIQKNLVNRVKLEYPDVLDLGVKQGPFYVLLGAAMPSVLVETAFISNPKEATRLADDSYRYKVAEGIFDGIREYILKTSSTLSKSRQYSGIQ